MIIMMIGLGLGSHFRDALEKSGKETFTKEDLCKCNRKLLCGFSGQEKGRGRALETGNSS